MEGIQILGAITGAGAVFAALAFAIGYLAIKQQDATLGLFTTTAYTSFVRAGAMFFPRTLQALVAFLTPYAWLFLLTLALIAVYIPLAHGLLVSRRVNYADVHAASLFVIASVVILATFHFVPLYLAPLHAVNRALLVRPYQGASTVGPLTTDTLGAADTPVATDTLAAADTPVATDTPAAADMPAAEPSTNPVDDRSSRSMRAAMGVYRELHDADSESALQLRYGSYCTAVLSFVVVSLLLRRWLHRIEERAVLRTWRETSRGRGTTHRWLRATKWVLRPVMLSLLLFFALTTPSIYGVVGLPYSFPCVSHLTLERETASEASKSPPESLGTAPVSDATGGDVPSAEMFRLLSDFSADIDEVVLYRWLGGRDQVTAGGQLYELRFHEREKVAEVSFQLCGEENILALKKEHVAVEVINPEADSVQAANPKPAADPARSRSRRTQ